MRKRKNNGNAPNGRLLLSIITAVAFLSVAALGYLWQQTEIHALGRQMKKLEVTLDHLKRANERLNRAYAEMCTPGALDLRIRQMGLGLVAPHPSQIVRMSEPVEEHRKEWAARDLGERGN